jgi:hypothetical protein
LTGATGDTLTLTHAVSKEEDIDLYINNVKQEPTTAYTVADTAVTLTGDVVASDDIYVVYNSLALQTVVPPDGSVTTAKLASGAAASNLGTSVNLATIKDSTGTNTAMTIDSSGRILAPQVPYFYFRGYAGLATSAIAGTDKAVYFDAIEESRGGGLDNSSTLGASYTVPVAGVYCIWANVGLTGAVNYLALSLYHGTTLKQKGWSGNDLIHYTNHVQVVMNLAQNDVIRCAIDGTYTVPATDPHYMNFCGYLIG